MLRYTTESFVLIYSSTRGIQLVPAVAARALRSRDLFDVNTIGWPQFLSGILCGRFGEPIGSRVPGSDRFGDGAWSPGWVLDIEASMARPKAAPASAAGA